MKILIAIFLFVFCLYAMAWAEYGFKVLTLVHKGTIVYGDASIDANGKVTLLNGKTVEEAARTFWPAAREKFSELRKAILSGRVRVDQIGFHFNGNKGLIRMSFVERRVSWEGYNPDAASRLYWDEVYRFYTR